MRVVLLIVFMICQFWLAVDLIAKDQDRDLRLLADYPRLHEYVVRADLMLEYCGREADVIPRFYIDLQKMWRVRLLFRDGLVDAASYEIFEKEIRPNVDSASLAKFCWGSLIFFKKALGTSSPFERKKEIK